MATFLFLYSRLRKFVVQSDTVSFMDSMAPSNYFTKDAGKFNYSKFGTDVLYWGGVMTSNLSLLTRLVTTLEFVKEVFTVRLASIQFKIDWSNWTDFRFDNSSIFYSGHHI